VAGEIRKRKFEYQPEDPHRHENMQNPVVQASASGSQGPKNPGRRKFIAMAGGAVIAAVAAGLAVYYSSYSQRGTSPSSSSVGSITSSGTGGSLAALGPSFMISDSQSKLLLQDTGISLNSNVTDLDSIRSIMTSGGGASTYDVVDYDSSGWLALKAISPRVTKDFSPSNIPRWINGPIYSLFTSPETTIGSAIPPPLGPTGPYIAKSLIYPQIWAASPNASDPMDDYGQKDKMFFTAPIDWNYDSVLYNPKYVNIPHDRYTGISSGSWGAMYDRAYKGKSAILDVPTTATNHVCIYLVANKMMNPPEVGPNDLLPSEMDIVVNFLIDQKKAGQFRVAWSDFNQLVSNYIQEEIWVSDAWQPVEYYVRHGGTPCYYVEPAEGYRCWLDGSAPTANTSKDNLVYQYINWELGPSNSSYKAKWLGYHVAIWQSDEIKNGMGPEFWDWMYNGKSTYSSEDPAKDALFDPIAYNWSTQPGNPNPNGNFKDCGSIDRRTARVGVWGRYPHYADYYFQAWNRFRTA
jgi:putative spermidine/putrescine transport system substrate-binding protein